jgi:hypothetical protein
MATVHVYNGYAFDLDKFDSRILTGGRGYTWSPNFYLIGYNNGSASVFTGTDIATAGPGNPIPISGTFSAITASKGGVAIFDISGFALSAPAFHATSLTATTADDHALFVSQFSGADQFFGSTGNDKFNGYGGNDTLHGGGGNDVLTGGTGRDVLTGGAGADTFDFNTANESGKAATTRDVITDFTHNAALALSDRIDVSTIDANGKLAGDATFTWLGAAAFNGHAGQLHYRVENPAGTVNDKTIVEGDINGDRIADFQIELTGLKALVAADFVL